MGFSVEKQFSLTRPCADCPFRADDQAIPLQPGRKDQIIGDLISQRVSTFHCHKSVYRKSGEGEDPNSRHHCPGAIAVVRLMGADTQAAKIATRLQIIQPDRYDQAMKEVIDPSDLD